ncbi:hypothetical protein RSOLAG1IB_11985 [Rhizoctonia solani AG-1 IB]|uniref:Uncharacterized protein n=1 Tax=Thanatephorus cucumeris (strain AG1-IB / isolate 7/3/14) TaxID=1108050 RepID=A0A0B7FKN1_THACB|nr:hypothetical protein RSOLAG1IB_11985 [Rhizoctonia solani AG-1 IB]
MASTTSSVLAIQTAIPSIHPCGTWQRHHRRKVGLCGQNVHDSIVIVSIASHSTPPLGSAHAYPGLHLLVIMATRRALLIACSPLSSSAFAARV